MQMTGNLISKKLIAEAYFRIFLVTELSKGNSITPVGG